MILWSWRGRRLMVDPGTAAIVAGGIGAVATVVAAIIGRMRGRKQGYAEGLEEGKKHSIEKFMDVYRDDIRRAAEHLEKHEDERARDVARGLVDNVKVWRDIQSSFAELLNGLVAELDSALRTGNNQLASRMIRTINEAYAGKRLAVETQLQRSRN
jgi:flagellar biosynthesis/type III secretory pathway protein FliH